MNPEQIRARLEEITGELEGINAGDDGYSDEQVASVKGLNAEFERLSAQLETAETMAAMKAKTSAPGPRKTTPAPVATRVEVGASASDKFGGFKNSGEFLMAVKKAGQTGQVAPQLQNVMYEKNAEDGGFLVPSDISDAIVKKLDDPLESLLAQTNQMSISGNGLHMNVDESMPWANGIVGYWTAEGEPIKESKPKFSPVAMRLHKVACMVKATDELLDDARALESYIQNGAPEALTYAINKAILTGDGVGKPRGLLTSPFAIEVAKEVGQPADTITPGNIIAMYSRMLPQMRAGAKWYGDVSVLEQFSGMKDGQGNYIFLQGGSQFNQQPYSLLLGLPVMPLLSGLPQLGDAGDLVLANLKSYWTIRKAGVKSATSIHLHFDREITAFRFSTRVDGQVPFKTPITSESGYTMSGIVKLGARA